MGKLGGRRFFATLPLRLAECDLNSLTYSQDSRSWLLPLVGKHMTIDANLDFYVEYFLPLVLKLDKMRELEDNRRNGSKIKVKKYETLLMQIW